MTILTLPIMGSSESVQSDHADCGTLAGDAILNVWYPQVALPTLDNATAKQVADAINAQNLPGVRAADDYPDDLNGYLAGYVPYGDYVIAGVRVDSWDCTPDPSGSAEHYLAIYSTDSRWYNCWPEPPQYQGPADLTAAYLATGTFVGVVRVEFNQVEATMGPYNTGQGVYWITLDGNLLPVKNPGNNNYVGVDSDDLNAMAQAQQSAYNALIAKVAGSITGTITGTISGK